MKGSLFLDTSFIYVLSDSADPDHLKGVELYRHLTEPVVLSSYVFAEAMSLLTKRTTKACAVRMGEQISTSDRVRVIGPSQADFDEAWDLFAKYPDWDFDLIDAISFALMHREGIERALTFDYHFEQMGFTALPG
jgi:predicted nucleic acid-binding protein